MHCCQQRTVSTACMAARASAGTLSHLTPLLLLLETTPQAFEPSLQCSSLLGPRAWQAPAQDGSCCHSSLTHTGVTTAFLHKFSPHSLPPLLLVGRSLPTKSLSAGTPVVYLPGPDALQAPHPRYRRASARQRLGQQQKKSHQPCSPCHHTCCCQERPLAPCRQVCPLCQSWQSRTWPRPAGVEEMPPGGTVGHSQPQGLPR